MWGGGGSGVGVWASYQIFKKSGLTGSQSGGWPFLGVFQFLQKT